MHLRTIHPLVLLDVVIILLIVNSIFLCTQQTQSTSIEMEEIQTEGINLGKTFITSYIPHSPIVITANANFVTQGFPGNGTEEDPFVISGYEITTAGNCIYIGNVDVYFRITDCSLLGSGTGVGVYLSNVTNGELRNNFINQKRQGVQFHESSNNGIVNNTISGQSYEGIGFYDSSTNNLIMNNTILDNREGVSLQSPDNLVVNNTILGNVYGVYLSHPNNLVENNTISGSSDYGVYFLYGSDCVVQRNTFEGNNYGVYLEQSLQQIVTDNIIIENGYGIWDFGSSDNTILNNIITDNSNTGIGLAGSSNNTISNNSILRNSGYGVYCNSVAENNYIFTNALADNDIENAFDIGNGNQWNTTEMGNYWGDYNGTGVYHVPGSAGSIDYHPEVYDILPPTINHPEDVAYERWTVDHNIIWIPNDAHPSHYRIFQNGIELITAPWDGSIITWNVEGLSVGSHNYTIFVYDLAGNSVSDTVFVIVSPQTTPTTSSTTPTTNTTTSSTHTDSTLPSVRFPLEAILAIAIVVSIISIVLVLLGLRRILNRWSRESYERRLSY